MTTRFYYSKKNYYTAIKKHQYYITIEKCVINLYTSVSLINIIRELISNAKHSVLLTDFFFSQESGIETLNHFIYKIYW